MSALIQVTCPHCLVVNRVLVYQLKTNMVNCGKCHQALFTGVPFEVNEAALNKHIQYNDVPVLVDFWAPWCGPCKMMASAYKQAAQSLEPEIRLLKVNTETEQALGARFNIRSIPTLALFKNGREVARQAGAMSADNIIRWVNHQR